ncbi:MAG: hypothetical protein U9Q77_00230 [Candidatus Marinimicrobia bacterium]|nr:hypothetical protein [Candidatus Neomarinimicrobiota bacterium]
MNPTRFALFFFILSLAIPIHAQPQESLKYNTMGLDMEILSYGGSLGGLYSFHFSEAFSLDLEMDWSLVESNDTFAYYDYFNRPVTINNRNLSFVKLLTGITWFPFLENMHPSTQVGGFVAAGPLLALNTADDEALFERWQHVETDLAPLVRSGVHLRILTGQGASYNFRLGYDYASFDQVIDSRQIYKGIFFQAAMEFIHR